MSDRPSPPRTTVVIPNWNGKHLLPIVLNSLAAQSDQDFEIVVVDSGSHDGSVEYLREGWPTVRVIALERNGGFSAAVNPGLQAAHGDYVALVNNDVELDPQWIESMVAALASEPRVASAVGKIVDFTQRDLIQEMGAEFAWDGFPRQRGRGDSDLGQFDEPAEVFSVCAGAALYRTSAIRHVGLFDEAYFAYLEDVDWGFRARRLGYRALYTPAATAFHIGSATTKGAALPTSKLHARNNLYLIAKNYPISVILLAAPVYLVPQVRLLARALRDGWVRQILLAYLEFARMLPRALKLRRETRRVHGRSQLRMRDLPRTR